MSLQIINLAASTVPPVFSLRGTVGVAGYTFHLGLSSLDWTHPTAKATPRTHAGAASLLGNRGSQNYGPRPKRTWRSRSLAAAGEGAQRGVQHIGDSGLAGRPPFRHQSRAPSSKQHKPRTRGRAAALGPSSNPRPASPDPPSRPGNTPGAQDPCSLACPAALRSLASGAGRRHSCTSQNPCRAAPAARQPLPSAPRG